MNCEEIKHLLSRYIDNQLDDSERNMVEEHLKSCQECSAYYQKLLELQKIADDFDISGDEQYWIEQKNEIIDRIEKLESAGTTPLPARRPRNVIYKLAAVAASIALIAFISIHESKNIQPVRGLFKPEEAPEITAQYRLTEQLQVTDTVRQKRITEKEKVEPPVTGQEPEIKAPRREMPVSTEETVIEEAAGELKPETITGGEGKKGAAPEDVVSPRPEEVERVADDIPESATPIKKVSTEPVTRPDVVSDKAVRIDTARFYQPKVSEVLSVESLSAIRSKGTAADEDIMAFSDIQLQSPEIQVIEPDSVLFEDFSAEEKLAYSEWHDKAVMLQREYGYLLSPHARMMAVKARRSLPPDSLNHILEEMAEAFYQLGVLTPMKEEREIMLKNLKLLKTKAEPAAAQKINGFISELENLAN